MAVANGVPGKQQSSAVQYTGKCAGDTGLYRMWRDADAMMEDDEIRSALGREACGGQKKRH